MEEQFPTIPDASKLLKQGQWTTYQLAREGGSGVLRRWAGNGASDIPRSPPAAKRGA